MLKKLILSIDTSKLYPHRNFKSLFASVIVFLFVMMTITTFGVFVFGSYAVDNTAVFILRLFSPKTLFYILLLEAGYVLVLFLIESLQDFLTKDDLKEDRYGNKYYPKK